MDYCYQSLVATCNKTRIYPSGCCPNSGERRDGCGCSCGGNCGGNCGCSCNDNSGCGVMRTVDETGVNRINFCPSCANSCCKHDHRPRHDDMHGTEPFDAFLK